MSLFSFLRKNKQDNAPDRGEFQSRAEEESEVVRGRGKRKAAAAEDPIDPVLPEKKRARRRLIGAIALVLAAVIGLPMIFDSEPKPLAEDIDIQIPSKDKLAQSGTVRRAAPAASVAASAALGQSEQIVDTSAADAPVKQAAAKADSKPVEAKQAEVKPLAESKPEQKAEAKPAEAKAGEVKSETKTVEAKIAENKPAQKSEPRAEARISEEERARAILEGRTPQKSDTAKPADDKKPGKFAVQVAALRTPEKINEVRGKLKQAGIDSYTQKVVIEGGESTRIRVGPFATKEEADKMNAKLARLGFNGKVVP